ncbi:hypothetical protein CLOM_g20440 [Closterium sp. NIES-68]|nr:hypothetical protein CLOM_g20440 [Closterium sp. NIES-68]GJP80281.1 hypothetical protein CLOP_g10508 [Closterium sp. NIES-67]
MASTAYHRHRAAFSTCFDPPPLPSAPLVLYPKPAPSASSRPLHALRCRAACVAVAASAAVVLLLTALCLLRASAAPPAAPLALLAPPDESSSGESALRFFVYRLIGNDMPPLQCDGQLYLNTLYTLQHEPRELPGVRRMWVLNNVLNATEQQRIVDAILAHGYSDEHIIYVRLNYTRLAAMPENRWAFAVTGLNEARNMMIEHGIAAGARWIMPMDGNHFLTRQGWAYTAAAADRHEAHGKTVFKMPRVKVDAPQSPDWINGSTLYSDLFPHAPAMHEGMIAFRNDSPHRYQPGLGFARRCKLEAFDRICGTGKYCSWLHAAHRLGLDRLLYPDFTPQLADTGECGCQREMGSEEKIRPMRTSVLQSCGVSVRLWYYPCPEVDAQRMMHDGWYRFKQRQKALVILLARIRERIKQETV